MRASPSIRQARPADLDAVTRLLRANGLPSDGLDPGLTGFVVAETADGVVGSCGVEAAGAFGLLRSAAVDADWRGAGIGRAMVEAVIAEARQRNVRALYLLTTTAADWFPAFGFVPADRSTAPAAIRATEEFTSACPASAALLRLDLTPSPEPNAGVEASPSS